VGWLKVRKSGGRSEGERREEGSVAGGGARSFVQVGGDVWWGMAGGGNKKRAK